MIKTRGDKMLGNDEVYNRFVNDFSTKIYNLKSDIPFSDYIFLCVGSDKIIGDTFGPLVGYRLDKLLKNSYNNIKVIGTLESPVSARNLDKEVYEIYNIYKNPCIIAIDAALSTQDNIGKIIVTNSKMRFGKSTNSKLLEVGNISIKGVEARDNRIPRHNFSK